ncbi:MAG: peptidoglycan-binding domain-containing protein [Candidatus Lernaella stagnicola]|nr:peptidoglycan-binding domain-containing protein [Candidatus Lernaella stagnicola]
MSDAIIASVLGLDPAVVEEAWAVEDGPYEEEIRVMQRSLIVLGFPTGERGRPWIDGVVGPATRRALKWWQEENGLDITGRFDDASRAKLLQQAADRLQKMSHATQISVRGQLDHVQNAHPVTGKHALMYYLNEAQARVPEQLVPAFLGLYVAFNNGVAVPGLELGEIVRCLAAGDDLKTARRKATRLGFLQLATAFVEEHEQLDAERAAQFGDLDYQFDILATLLQEEGSLGKAAAKQDADGMERALAENAVGCVTPAPQPLRAAIAEIVECLAREG